MGGRTDEPAGGGRRVGAPRRSREEVEGGDAANVHPLPLYNTLRDEGFHSDARGPRPPKRDTVSRRVVYLPIVLPLEDLPLMQSR